MSKWYPIGSHSFRVIIGNRKIGFSNVRGISLMNPASESKFVSVLKQGRPEETRIAGIESDDFENSSYDNEKTKILTLEKALQPKKSDSNQEFLLKLIDKNVDIEEIRIEILNDSREVTAIFVFKKCYVISYDVSDLDAINSNYLKQIIKIQYQSAEMQLP